MNLYFFSPQTLSYDLVRSNVDKLSIDEIKSAIVEYFYENSLDIEAGDIRSIENFETTTNLFYQVECKEQIFVFIKSEQQRINSYNTLVEKRDRVTLTTITGETYEL